MSDSNDDRDQESGPTKAADLRAALGDGDPRKIADLIAAGADIHYKRDHGYDALLDAVHGRDVARDPRLLELLALLASHGVGLSGVSEYGESGLRVLSRVGRFDAVRLLLDAGADRSQLEWTPLIEAVALGSLADVEAIAGKSESLEERDRWSRTAWLIALLIGDIAKAKLLRELGADPNASGRCACPPLFYAIQGHHPRVLRWLLDDGADVHQANEYGTTALMEAVENDDLECVEVLLHAGADVEVNANGTALSRAGSREIILRLLDAGADPADMSNGGDRQLLGLSTSVEDALAAVTPDDFRRDFTRLFGENNPERKGAPFWEAMIRCGTSAYRAREWLEASCGPVSKPVWCAARYGQTLTLLPNGRAIQIGGEHEDFYDPDFCIYNDVFVHEQDRPVAIYSYPESVFPPTDFHTATLVGDFIYVIGSLGYQGTRLFGETPVYRLNVRTLGMERVEASGEAPGWIYRHRAVAEGPNTIRVWSGTIVTENIKGESHGPNLDTFVFDLVHLRWHRKSPTGSNAEIAGGAIQ